MQLIARAPDTGRSSSHLSSPRTARVAKAESSRGGGKRTGLSASHAATTTPCLALRFQTGSRTSGVDAHRVHALQGCECREKTHRLKCAPVEVMATVLSRRRRTCCWWKTAVGDEPRARRLGDPHAVPNDGVGAHDEGRGCPRMCMHSEQGHRPEVPKGVTLPAFGDTRSCVVGDAHYAAGRRPEPRPSRRSRRSSPRSDRSP